MKLDNISKIFNAHSEEIKALDSVSYEFEKQKFYAIMGHSGSGKTTLINILGLITKPTQGKYYLNDIDVSTLNDEELSRLRMSSIGFIFQDFKLDEHMNALDNVILPMLINKKISPSERVSLAQELLKSVNLDNRLKHFPKELSGGEQQRVAIARALANNPEYIICDEPTGNLDEKNERMVFELLKELTSNGHTIIVVSHSEIVKEFADIILNLQAGKLSDE